MGEAYIFKPDDLENGQELYPIGADFAQLAGISDRINLLEQYGDSAFNLGMRFDVYNYAMDDQPVTQEQVFNMLAEDLNPDDTLLDVGCANRRFLAKIRRDLQHQGRLIGVDVVNMASRVNERLISEGLDPVEFRQEPASRTSLEPQSVDKITALFVMYYDPQALSHLYDLIKDGGSIYLATSGDRNKIRQRFWERFATEHIKNTDPEHADLQPPPIHAARYDDKIAKRELTSLFGQVFHKPQNTFMKIDNEDSQEAYRMSLLSMNPSLTPIWRQTIDDKVMPLVREEIRRNGFYWDVIDRHIFKAIKTAPLGAV